jgi:hypothetical protein
LLVGLRDDEITGSVEIRETTGRPSIVYVRAGLPVHVVRPDSLDRLDLVLVEAGLVTSADIARAQLVRESTGQLMGQVLCELGLVEQQKLSEALRWQLRRKVTRLFSWTEGTFAVSRADHPFGMNASSPGASIDPRSLVFPGILAGYPRRRLAAELAPLAGRRVRLAPVSAAHLNGLGFTAEHAPLLIHLRRSGFRLQDQWIRREDQSPRAREARAVLLALLYLGLLEVLEDNADDATPEHVVEATPSAPVLLPAASTPLPEVDHVHLFALAIRCLRNGELTRAEESFETVAKQDSNNHRARAFLTWIAFWKKRGQQRDAALELTLKAIRETIRAEPDFALGHYFMGELWKLRNELGKAEHAFRAAVMHDPDLIEAHRELRLLSLRKTRR